MSNSKGLHENFLEDNHQTHKPRLYYCNYCDCEVSKSTYYHHRDQFFDRIKKIWNLEPFSHSVPCDHDQSVLVLETTLNDNNNILWIMIPRKSHRFTDPWFDEQDMMLEQP